MTIGGQTEEASNRETLLFIGRFTLIRKGIMKHKRRIHVFCVTAAAENRLSGLTGLHIQDAFG